MTFFSKYIGCWIELRFDNTVRIWDFKTGKEVSYSPLQGRTDWVYSVAISWDKQYVVSASRDNTIRIWSLKLLAYVYKDNKEEEWKIKE